MRPLPIRLRLTLWYSVLFATAALLLSATSWWMLRYTSDATVHQDLRERVDDVREQLHQYGPDITPQQVQERFDAIYKYRDDGKWLQILDQDGRWIYRSSRMVSASASLALPSQIPSSGLISGFQQGLHRVRTLSSSITVYGHTYSVETGVSMKKPEALLQRFGLGLFLLTPAVLFAALIAGHVMSRKALAPVLVIANEARRITDKNLDARLPVYATQDEIAHLSTTLNNMLGRLDAGFRSVRDFTANASHELRTPLARLRTEVEIALLSPRSALEYRDTLEHIEDVAVDMTQLLDGLLMLARAEAGADGLRLSPVDLGELIDASIREFRPVAKHLSIELESKRIVAGYVNDDQPIMVLADRTALMRLLRILLDNACKFTPARGTVAIAAAATPESILLSVEDSGIGIALHQQQRIFERFYRVRGDAGRPGSGSGLGLSMAASIAEQHQTSIQLKSAPGAGSRFEIGLARVPERERNASSVPLSHPSVVSRA
jgi:signal transduction histidine kinase